MLDLRILLAVALGGGLGSVLRYAVTFAMTQRFGPGFPFGTWAINISGCLAIGFIAGLAQARGFGPPAVRTFLIVGVLGGYTTFSTFAYDTLTLAGEGSHRLAFLYAGGSVLGGLLAAYLGLTAARALTIDF